MDVPPASPGAISVDSVEILQGLKEGDEVILSDMLRWDRNARIRWNDGTGRVNMAIADDALISMKDVRKTFYLDEVETHALSGVNLEIRRGEYVCVAGPSGSGKPRC